MSTRLVHGPYEQPERPLRELGDDEFKQRYDCDRFTATLLVNRFRHTLDHIATKLMTNAFSLVIRDMMDFCVTLSGPPEIGWPMPAASLSNPIHWGPAADAVRVVLEEYGVERLQLGDLLIANDSYRTGKHLNDTSFIAPMFHEGKMLGALHITAHQLDLGSRVPGAFDIASATLWEDGLVLSPMLLFRAGELDKSVYNLIGANTRFPEVVLPDLKVIQNSLVLGQDLLAQTIERYGVDAYLGAMRYACESSAEIMSRALRAIPDGDYEGHEIYDGDGLAGSPEYRLSVSVRKCEDRIEFDFSGTSHQTRTSLNCGWPDVKTGVMLALKMLLDPRSPANSGMLRTVDIVMPYETILNPRPPAATMYYVEIVQGIVQAIVRALNPALGEHAIAPDPWWLYSHHAHGKTADGEDWVSLAVASAMPTSAWGATSRGDGDSNSLMIWMNFLDSGVEPREAQLPLIALRHETMIDTAGPGQNRGGGSTVSDICWLHAGHHRGFAMHVKRSGGGACGGAAGRLGAAWLLDHGAIDEPDFGWPPASLEGAYYKEALPLIGRFEPLTGKSDPEGEYRFITEPVSAGRGAIVRAIGSGAGGWGDPFARDPVKVLADVRNEYISIGAALRDYGVAVVGDPLNDPEALSIDWEKTERRRSQVGTQS